MKKVYKLIAIAVFGFAMIFAQDTIAQRGGQGRGNDDRPRGDDQGEIQDQDRFRGKKGPKYKRHHSKKGQGRYGRHHGSYQDLEINFWGHPYKIGRIYVHHGRAYAMRKGVFYIKRHRRWIAVQPPYGLRVDFIPRGANVVYSRRGIMHEYRGTFYQELRGYRGGVVVVAPPRRFRHHNNW